MTTIPHVLHQVWIGGPPPGWVRRFWDSWDAALESTDWTVERHTDDNLAPDLAQLCANAQQRGLTLRGTADLLRLRILQQRGGVYTDSDTMPLTHGSDLVGRLTGDRTWYGVRPDMAPTVIENGTIGAPPGAPETAAVLAYAAEAMRRGLTSDHHVAGPAATARALAATGVEQRTLTAVRGGPYAAAVRRGQMPDAARARAAHPHAAILHVLCNYGDWKGRRHDDA